MNPARRRWLLALGWAAGVAPGPRAEVGAAVSAAPAPGSDPVRPGRPLDFPRDHGAHLGSRIEWWYATGWLGSESAPRLGFQLTFFRSRTGLAADNPSRFAPRHLLMAHAALVDLQAGRHLHDQRIVRWSGDPRAAAGHASTTDGEVQVGNWQLRRTGETWHATLPAAAFDLQLSLQRSQPLLAQGEAGFSRKGPDETQASHYYSDVQLLARTHRPLGGDDRAKLGRAWLDHEWSDDLLHPQAVGWDWIGINLFDGSALTAFVLRRADGSRIWAGGSFRAAASPVRNFDAQQVEFHPVRRWRSPRTQADYPVHWQLTCPAGRFELRALLDAQELDSRASTGAVYWEGLSELLDVQGRRVGLGYLEMTGYAGALRLG